MTFMLTLPASWMSCMVMLVGLAVVIRKELVVSPSTRVNSCESAICRAVFVFSAGGAVELVVLAAASWRVMETAIVNSENSMPQTEKYMLLVSSDLEQVMELLVLNFNLVWLVSKSGNSSQDELSRQTSPSMTVTNTVMETISAREDSPNLQYRYSSLNSRSLLTCPSRSKEANLLLLTDIVNSQLVLPSPPATMWKEQQWAMGAERLPMGSHLERSYSKIRLTQVSVRLRVVGISQKVLRMVMFWKEEVLTSRQLVKEDPLSQSRHLLTPNVADPANMSIFSEYVRRVQLSSVQMISSKKQLQTSLGAMQLQQLTSGKTEMKLDSSISEQRQQSEFHPDRTRMQTTSEKLRVERVSAVSRQEMVPKVLRPDSTCVKLGSKLTSMVGSPAQMMKPMPMVLLAYLALAVVVLSTQFLPYRALVKSKQALPSSMLKSLPFMMVVVRVTCMPGPSSRKSLIHSPAATSSFEKNSPRPPQYMLSPQTSQLSLVGMLVSQLPVLATNSMPEVALLKLTMRAQMAICVKRRPVGTCSSSSTGRALLLGAVKVGESSRARRRRLLRWGLRVRWHCTQQQISALRVRLFRRAVLGMLQTPLNSSAELQQRWTKPSSEAMSRKGVWRGSLGGDCTRKYRSVLLGRLSRVREQLQMKLGCRVTCVTEFNSRTVLLSCVWACASRRARRSRLQTDLGGKLTIQI